MLTVFANQNIKPIKEDELFEIISPGYVMKSLYKSFNETNYKIESYLVMLYGIYNTKSLQFTYTSAGINVPPLIIKSTGEISEMKIEGFPICKLGNFYMPYFEDISIQLNVGDIVLFYTDGLVEYSNENGIMYSHNDLKDFLTKHYSMKASELYSAIKENLFKKIGNKKISDDVTFLIMEIH